jgi:NADH-quinone oxidoreductase subunit L
MYGLLLIVSISHSNSVCISESMITEKICVICGMCVCVGVWCKCAMIGLHVWLLDAMEGPTPVSALLHSATIVTAGIIILTKLTYLLEYTISTYLYLLSTLSIILNSFTSLFHFDIKRLIAYSTHWYPHTYSYLPSHRLTLSAWLWLGLLFYI